MDVTLNSWLTYGQWGVRFCSTSYQLRTFSSHKSRTFDFSMERSPDHRMEKHSSRTCCRESTAGGRSHHLVGTWHLICWLQCSLPLAPCALHRLTLPEQRRPGRPRGRLRWIDCLPFCGLLWLLTATTAALYTKNRNAVSLYSLDCWFLTCTVVHLLGVSLQSFQSPIRAL